MTTADQRCEFCGRLESQSAYSTHCSPPFPVRAHKFSMDEIERREQIARICLRHMFGFEFTGDSLCDEADRIFAEPHPRAARSVALADAILAALTPARASIAAAVEALKS